MKIPGISIFITLLAAGSVIAAISYNAENTDANKMGNVKEKMLKVPDISVIQVQQADYQSLVAGFGEAQAHYQLELTNEVSGKVEVLSPSLETGKDIKKSDLLVTLDDTQYKQALATAKADYADARLTLLEEERRGQQAKLEWSQSGLKGKPDSPLVLRRPQLDFAQARLEQAKNTLLTARKNLSKTRIRAPFNAVVVSRQVQPGRFLPVGNVIASLYSTDKIEVMVPLSSRDWQLLANIPKVGDKSRRVTLRNIENKQQWQGYIGRVEQHLNNNSRQRILVVIVEKPLQQQTPLYPGTFLRAQIPGRVLHNIWRVPASAISQNGDIWLVAEDNTLTRHPVNKLYEQGKFSYILPVNSQAHALIVLRPLNSYVVGMRMHPIEHKS